MNLLPPLVCDYRDASIEELRIGPRRELVLVVGLLEWAGCQGRIGARVRVRLGGIENLAEVAEFFANAPQQESELGFFGYDPSEKSKPGKLRLKINFERIEACLVIRCSSLSEEIAS